jgi:hypothetical protein
VRVGELAQPLHEFIRSGPHPAFALDWFNQKRRRPLADRRFCARQIVEIDIDEPVQQRGKALVHLLLIACRNCRHGAAVKGVLERDDLEAIRTRRLMKGARRLDRALDRLRARIGEKHRVGKGRIDQPLRQLLPLRTAIQVRHMHQRRRLILNRLGQMRMPMPQQIDRNPAGEIERAGAILRNQPRPLTAHRTKAAARINGHQRRDRHGRDPLRSGEA